MKQTRRIADRYLRFLANEIFDLKHRCAFARESYLEVAGLSSRPFDAVRPGRVSDPTGETVLRLGSITETFNASFSAMQEKRQVFDSLIFSCSREEKEVISDYYLKNMRVKEIQRVRNLSEITVKKRLCAGRDAAYAALLTLSDGERGGERHGLL